MDKEILTEVKKVIINSVGSNITPELLTVDYQLVGNILDSMAITTLILALEEHFGFTFSDEELIAEAFETVDSLSRLVENKL